MFVDIAYGIHAKPEDDEFIGVADEALRGVEKCTNMNIIDILPWSACLKSSSFYPPSRPLIPTRRRAPAKTVVQHIPSWIPGMWWKKKIDLLKSKVLLMSDAPYGWVRERLVSRFSCLCIRLNFTDRLHAAERRFGKALCGDGPYCQVRR